MRVDSLQFASANEAADKRPRFVVAILFDVGSLYITSHDDIPSVPGIVLNSALKAPSAISQKIIPDQGRSEIGTFSFSLVDLGSAFTNEARSKLGDGKGLRGKLAQLWVGFEGFDFTAFQLFQTQTITNCEYDSGAYTVQCADITREQRKDIFEPVSTTLQASCGAADTTITVADTSKFVAVAHGPAWSDAPSATVYYFKIKEEIIRATGKTAGSFTGCTRGVFNTLATAYTFESTTPTERRPKVEEFIYLELPAVKLAYAVLTGSIHGTANTLPAHWHLGVDPSLVRLADFTGIGTDLWDATDDTRGFPLRFEGLKKQDGKRFLEREIYLLLGAYQPIYSDGQVGLRRLPAMISDAAPLVTLTEREVVSAGALEHDYGSLHNQFQIDWAYDNVRREYTRRTAFIDGDSIAIHGEAPILKLAFQGLHGAVHTDAIIQTRLDAIRDAYAYPPQRINVTIRPSLNRFEVGDVMRVKIAGLRDFAGGGASIDRSFVSLRRSVDFATGELTHELLGSTLRPTARPPTPGAATPLPDAFYSSAGVALNTVIGMTGNTVNAGTHTINGAVDLNASGSIFYHLGDLTIPDGAVINITGNVQLRVRGFVTVNGDIVGTGGGWAGVADPGIAQLPDPGDVPPLVTPVPGNPGFVGNSRGGDGVAVVRVGGRPALRWSDLQTVPVALTRSLYEACPEITLRVDGSSLLGLPSDLRGTGGGPGGRFIFQGFQPPSLAAFGSDGAAGGAGLAIICRGMTFGASGSIVLDGASAALPSLYTGGDTWFDYYPGTGGAGGPGALYVLLDGNSLSIPNIGGRFFARTGSVGIQGYPMPGRQGRMQLGNPTGSPWIVGQDNVNISGYVDESIISNHDLSNAAHRVQYVPETQVASPDADDKPPAPTALTVTGESGFNAIRVTPPARSTYDFVEVWASIDNNRANAVRIGRGDVSEFKHELPVLAARWYWSRDGKVVAGGREVFSDWFPAGATSGVTATTLNPAGWTPVVRGGGGATMIATASTIEKSGGVAAWDSDVYSREAFPDGAMVTFRPAQTTADLMVALNSDPATDQNYTSLDFAWHLVAGGTTNIYESGVQAVAGAGSYDTSTVFAIREVGGVVQYLRNGTIVRAVQRGNRLPFALDTSFYTPGGKIVDVHFSVGAARPASGNLLSVDLWRAGALSANFGAWSLNQDAANENQIINSTGPRGATQLVWECRCQNPGFGTGGDSNGGWNNSGDLSGLDATKTYRSTVWVRRRASTGNNFYHGCDDGGATINLDGSANSNPYFIGGQALFALTADKWYLSVGFIHGNGYSGGNSGLSGIYDPATGRVVIAANEFRMASGATTQEHRAYMYYGGDATTRMDLAEPRFEEVNGNEPSIASLLVPPDADNTDKRRLVPDGEFSLPTPSNYWAVDIGSGGNVVFSATGGAVGGYVTMTWGTGDTSIRALRYPPLQPLADLLVSIQLRVRRTASLPNSVTLQIDLARSATADFASIFPGNQPSVNLDNTTLPAVNTWYEFNLTGRYVVSSSAPFGTVVVRCVGSGAGAGQSVDIDAINAQIGPTLFSSALDGVVPKATGAAGDRLLQNDATWVEKTALQLNANQLATPYTDADTSTSFTVGAGHAETIRRFTSSSAITITLPNSIPSGWAVGQSMVFIRGGTGTLTFSSAGTIRSPGGSAITVQNGKVCATLAASGVWELSGNL